MNKQPGSHKRSKSVPFVHVNISLFADKVGITTTNTLDVSHGVHDFFFTINVGVEETQNVLKVFRDDDGLERK